MPTIVHCTDRNKSSGLCVPIVTYSVSAVKRGCVVAAVDSSRQSGATAAARRTAGSRLSSTSRQSKGGRTSKTPGPYPPPTAVY